MLTCETVYARRSRYDKDHQRREGACPSRERRGREHEDRRALGQYNIRHPGREQVAVRRVVARRGDSEQDGANWRTRQGPRDAADAGPRGRQRVRLRTGRDPER